MGEYTRRIQIKIEVDLWDWSGSGSVRDTIDITNDVLNYRFQKTIKTPKGSCQLAMLPQSAATHILDILSPMDVVRISEFGVLKFVGYIVRISYTGVIKRDGKPGREATITVAQFGGLLVDATIGFGLGTALGKEDGDLVTYATEFIVAVENAVIDGMVYAELITLLYNNFKDALTALDATNFVTYLDKYLNPTDGLTSSKQPVLPRTFELYTGMEQSMSFWQVAEQLGQKPFNEFFIDNGPRKIFIDGETIELKGKSHLIFREAPFNGTVGGVSDTSFDNMGDGVYVDENHLTRFDLARSMDEVYSAYSVKEAAFTLNEIERILLGQWAIDLERVGKYLFKPLVTELFYTRVESVDTTLADVTSKDLETEGENAALTLKAWFEHNDEYLSGAISHMVPSDSALDPKIGDKLRVYGIEGAFYVEGIAHTWAYQGPLQSNLTVTRGYNRTKKIELKDRIFRRNRAG